MKKIIVFMSIIGLISAGCEFLGEDEEPDYLYGLWASVYQVEVMAVGKGFVDFHCMAGVGDPCHEFERAVIDRDGTDVMIRVYSKRERARECPAVLDEIEVTLRIMVPGGEDYTFHFWRQGSTTLDTSLYVPWRLEE